MFYNYFCWLANTVGFSATFFTATVKSQMAHIRGGWEGWGGSVVWWGEVHDGGEWAGGGGL